MKKVKVIVYVSLDYQNRTLFRHKKECNFAICNNINRFGRYYSKWNKPEYDKYCMISPYMWNLKVVVTNEEREGERGGRKGKQGVKDLEIQTTIFKINKLQRYTAQHKEL